MKRKQPYRFYKCRVVGSILLTLLVFTVLQVAFKPLFMLYNYSVYSSCSAKDYAEVMWHGLPMDLSMAGYLTLVPALLALASIWLNARLIKALQKTYALVAALLLGWVYLLDAVLYGYWGFRIDATPVFYFLSSPKDALASVSVAFVVVGIVVWVVLVVVLFLLLRKALTMLPESKGSLGERMVATGVALVSMALLIIPIRGSVTTSTMNIGRVYYSDHQRLNHAAINPCFSLLSSLMNDGDVKGQYRFMKDDEANRLFARLRDTTTIGGQGISILHTRRPNVILVVLESFSAKIMQTLGGEPNVAVNMDRLVKEGVLFTHFYANSFRTDRGLAAILAGFPAQPTMSIMKFPAKTESLPMFPKVMKGAGYDLAYYYGGDADFTNMRSFLTTAGFEKIVCDADFPLHLRLSKWGVPDEYVFNRALEDLRKPSAMPYLKVIQTSSSHEPFDVPYHRLENKILNAFAYTDDCLGRFIAQAKRFPEWKNTLVILVPDHLGCYPENIDNYSIDRYHIPLIFLGGALKGGGKIGTYGSQVDIAATLLSQLGLSYKAFTFSKDLLNPKVPHFGFATVPNVLIMITKENAVVFNCDTKTVISDTGRSLGRNLPYGKAYLQKIYDDIASR